MEGWTLGTAITVAVLLLGGVVTFWRVTGRLSERIAKLETDNDTFWRVIGPALAGVIHSPKHYRRDVLVDRAFVNHEELTIPELNELKDLLETEALEGETEWKRTAAALLAMRADRELEDKVKENSWPKLRSTSS